jgi:hypothetical protein
MLQPISKLNNMVKSQTSINSPGAFIICPETKVSFLDKKEMFNCRDWELSYISMAVAQLQDCGENSLEPRLVPTCQLLKEIPQGTVIPLHYHGS